MPPIADVIRNAHRTAQAVRGVTLSIVRGELTEEDVPAVVHKTTWLEQNVEGVVVRARARDFLIVVADYRLDGSPVVPVKGDRLIETTDAVRTYEVLPAAGEDCYRESDLYHATYRVHTKQVDGAPLDD